jgi:uncharacterized BrkB/YihY/UPF0761 family membrane protein
MLTLKNRLFSFGLILAIGFLLLVSLVISSLLAAMNHWFQSAFSTEITYLMYAIELIGSLSVISFLFALMFRFLPDVKIGWRNIWMGALVTGALFIVGKYGLSFYFGKANPGSTYGAAGSLVLVMLWVSYSSMIVFFGAAFTREYAVAKGTQIRLTKNTELLNPLAPGNLIPFREGEEDTREGAGKEKVLSSTAELEREIDGLSLKRVILKIQIKDIIMNFFRFRKTHGSK